MNPLHFVFRMESYLALGPQQHSDAEMEFRVLDVTLCEYAQWLVWSSPLLSCFQMWLHLRGGVEEV